MRYMSVFLLCLLFIQAGCGGGDGEKTVAQEEQVLGNWFQLRSRTYILLIVSPQGQWQSSVRIADATEKIVAAKGSAKGTWHISDKQIVFTVTESNIEKVWEKNTTNIFEIVQIEDSRMTLKGENGRVEEWQKTLSKSGKGGENSATAISLDPIAVNLNKISSNTEDRYLCLKMELLLNELMPGQEMPLLHPRAMEAITVFLSSLIYNDIKDFDRLEVQKAKLINVVNPYMEGVVKDIKIEHVIVTTSYEKVEEFLVEHTVAQTPPPGEEGEEGEEEPKE